MKKLVQEIECLPRFGDAKPPSKESLRAIRKDVDKADLYHCLRDTNYCLYGLCRELEKLEKRVKKIEHALGLGDS